MTFMDHLRMATTLAALFAMIAIAELDRLGLF